MIPTLHPSGNVVLAERISTRSRKLSRGDVIVLQSPEDPNKIPIKRVIGLEGDCVSFVVDPEKNDELRTIVVCCLLTLFFFHYAYELDLNILVTLSTSILLKEKYHLKIFLLH